MEFQANLDGQQQIIDRQGRYLVLIESHVGEVYEAVA